MARTDQLVRDVILALGHEALGPVVEVDEVDRPSLLAGDFGQPGEELRIRLVHPDVDLAAAGKPDRQREIVGDPVGEQPRLAAGEHLPGRLDDLALDATPRDGAGELAALRDDQLGTNGPRRRPPSGDHTCHRHAVAASAPALQLGQDFAHSLMLVPTQSPEASLESEAFARWLVAAADGFAEGAAFHFQAAAAAKRRSDSGPDEQGPHQAGPENHVRHEKLTRHTGRYRPVGRRGLAFEAQLE